MKLRKPLKKDFPVPNDGLVAAVLADINDLGTVTDQYGSKPKLQFVFLIEERDKDGNPLRVFKRYHNTLHDSSHLTAAIKTLTGKLPDDGFDTETLIGRHCQLLIQRYTDSKGQLRAGIEQLMPPNPRNPVVEIPLDFKRKQTGTDGTATPGNKPNGKPVSPKTSRKTEPSLNFHGLEITDEDVAI